jgi:enoyl-CoA hydratase/carnithine racemase
MSQHIRTTLEEQILTVTLSRPDRKNAIDNAMYGAMADALIKADSEPDIRCIVFVADGPDFTAGNDIGDFSAIADGTFAGEWQVTRFLKALATASCPVIAAVQGHAIGIGTTMLFHCDLVVVADDVMLATPFANLAVVQEAASSILVSARIGHARAYAMFALGQTIDAQSALSLGIANQVVAASALPGTARELARQIARRPAGALRAMKKLMRETASILAKIDEENAAFLACLHSVEAHEARLAFAEHRKPDFTGIQH